MAPSSTRTKSTSRCWYSATGCIAMPSSGQWRSFRQRKIRRIILKTGTYALSLETVKERNDDHRREEVTESGADQRAHEDSAAGDDRATGRSARPQLRRSQSWIRRGTG